MSEELLPSYNDVTEALENSQSTYQAAQAHGLLCGLLCGNPEIDAGWEKLIAGPEQNATLHALLHTLHDVSKKELASFSFDFQLLLPDEEEKILVRAEALGLWCQGFLSGLKLTQVPITERPPGEVTETLTDLIEIAKINYETIEENDESETAYVELYEYVRLAVIMIYQELRNNPVTNQTQVSLH